MNNKSIIVDDRARGRKTGAQSYGDGCIGVRHRAQREREAFVAFNDLVAGDVDGDRGGFLAGQYRAGERHRFAAVIVRVVGRGRGEGPRERNIAGRAAGARDREDIVRRAGLAFVVGYDD
jgi:hypothetical protein